MWSDALRFSKVADKDAYEKHLEVRCDSIHDWISIEVESSGKGDPSRPAPIALLFGRILTSIDYSKTSKVSTMSEVISFGRGEILNEGGR